MGNIVRIRLTTGWQSVKKYNTELKITWSSGRETTPLFFQRNCRNSKKQNLQSHDCRRPSTTISMCPCHFSTERIKALHNFLSFAALSNVCYFAISIFNTTIQLHKLIRQVTRCFSLLLLSSVCPSFLIMCPRKFRLFL